MRSPLNEARGRVPVIEEFEPRLVLSNSVPITIPLDPSLDQFGDQIISVQAYANQAHMAFGIFDTGAAALTFSAADQLRFAEQGSPIPIKVPNGAQADGVGGMVIGDVAQAPPAGTGILASGLHAVTMTFNGSMPEFSPNFLQGIAITPWIQALIGTAIGSPMLPTITGMPIMDGGSSAHPGPYAALVTMEGASLNFSSVVNGLDVTLPDLSFVDTTTQLSAAPGTFAPVQIPLSLYGVDNHTNPGDSVTEAPTPVQTDVSVSYGVNQLGGQSFLLDTGSQMTVISPATALALGVDLAHPQTYVTLQGVGGSVNVPGYTINSLDLPLTNGSELQFTNVPIFVMNVADGLDGLLGMNLWNSAYQLLYNPYAAGGPQLSVSFYSTAQAPNGSEGDDVNELQELGVPIAGPSVGPLETSLDFSTGAISGTVFQDYNTNGVLDSGEPGVPDVPVYIDLSNSGQYQSGDPLATTDSNGHYEFNMLNPGTYTVREVVPSNMIAESGTEQIVSVQPNATTSGVNFANVTVQPNPFASFLNNLYGTVFSRPPDVAGYNLWMTYLQEGGSEQTVATAFWASPEHRHDEITQYYETYLNRTPDPSGLAYWTSVFQAGYDETYVQVQITSSAEYQAEHPDNPSFLESLYAEVLDRQPSGNELQLWEEAMNFGMTRQQVADAILTSPEAYQLTVDNYYTDFLHRSADSSGQTAWVNLLQTQQVNSSLVAEDFLSSSEYNHWTQQFSATA